MCSSNVDSWQWHGLIMSVNCLTCEFHNIRPLVMQLYNNKISTYNGGSKGDQYGHAPPPNPAMAYTVLN